MKQNTPELNHETAGDNSPISPQSLRSRLREAWLTDIGMVERFKAKHAKDFRYCHTSDQWFHWNKKYWEKLKDASKIHSLIKEISNDLIYELNNFQEEGKIRNEIIKAVKHYGNEISRKAVYRDVRDTGGMGININDLDKEKYLLNVANGTLDLRTGILQEHNKRDFISKYINVKYKPNALAGFWDRFLAEIMEDNKELIKFLQRIVGYSLSGDTDERKIFILYGKQGRNGKSVFIETLSGLLGSDYSLTLPVEVLLSDKNDRSQQELARLQSIRFVTCSETQQGRSFAESRIKWITGQDRITARALYQNTFEYHPEFHIFLCTNHKPRIYGTDGAIWDRICLIPFRFRVPDDNITKRSEFTRIFHIEREGILAWAVEGFKQWFDNGLDPPAGVTEAVKDYRAEEDILGEFINDRCIEGDKEKATPKELYQDYLSWCEHVEMKDKEIITRQKFGRCMGERYDKRTDNYGRHYYYGISVVTNSLQETDLPEILKNDNRDSL